MAKEDSSPNISDLEKAASGAPSRDALSSIVAKDRFNTTDINKALTLKKHNLDLPLDDRVLNYATYVDMQVAGVVEKLHEKLSITNIETNNDSLMSNLSQLEDFAPKTSAPQIKVLENEIKDVRAATNTLYDDMEKMKQKLENLTDTQGKPLTQLLEEYVSGKKSKDELINYLKPIDQTAHTIWEDVDQLVTRQKDITAQQKKLFHQSNILAEEHKIPMKAHVEEEETPRFR